ncbi:hypothetical protein AAIR98_001230 [Elusimicrobium simillimum]|uniref:hypothetical protein n=1 Tax=Elusimicrobium simillimum TaxID=3143438 RepID=UPI003C70593F
MKKILLLALICAVAVTANAQNAKKAYKNASAMALEFATFEEAQAHFKQAYEKEMAAKKAEEKEAPAGERFCAMIGLEANPHYTRDPHSCLCLEGDTNMTSNENISSYVVRTSKVRPGIYIKQGDEKGNFIAVPAQSGEDIIEPGIYHAKNCDGKDCSSHGCFMIKPKIEADVTVSYPAIEPPAVEYGPGIHHGKSCNGKDCSDKTGCLMVLPKIDAVTMVAYPAIEPPAVEKGEVQCTCDGYHCDAGWCAKSGK